MTRQEAFKVIMTLTLVIGGGFHPDNSLGDYVNTHTDKSSYTDAECKKWDELLDQANAVLGEDVYRVGMAFMELNDEFKLRSDDHKLP